MCFRNNLPKIPLTHSLLDTAPSIRKKIADANRHLFAARERFVGIEENLTPLVVRRLRELSDSLGENQYQADARKIASPFHMSPLLPLIAY